MMVIAVITIEILLLVDLFMTWGAGWPVPVTISCCHQRLSAFQVSVVGLATMVIARDINACEQATPPRGGEDLEIRKELDS